MPSESLKWPPKEKIVFCEKVKSILRKPAGELVKGQPDEVAEKVKEIIEKEKPRMVIVVGDYTSKKLREKGIKAKLYVIDGKTERRRIPIFDLKDLKIEKVENEQGTLNPHAVKKLHEILNDPEAENVAMLVEGEEDLLTLAAILSAPEKSIIVYGQPGEGNVIVRVNNASKKHVIEILKLNEKYSRKKR